MIRVDRIHDTTRCLALSALLISAAASAESLYCSAESASGFVFDAQAQTWKVSSFPVEKRQYRVAPANEDDIFAKALKYDYEVRDAVSSKPVIHCKTVRLPDSNEETGLIICKGSFGASFNIDKQTGRYIRSQPTGYVTRQAGTQGEDGPFMEIGNCSPE